MDLISAEKFLSLPKTELLDVRAEVEFQAGHFPGSVHSPLLTNEERHLVGIRYKEEGQEAAIRLGHQLVDPHRADRVQEWRKLLSRMAFPALTCFRGGLRSETAQRWLAEAGFASTRVEGGYKALRHLLLSQWEVPLRGFVVAGLTGSAKTRFIRGLGTPRALDLEAMAMHRGSAFGGLFQAGPQPAQQTFENTLAIELLRHRKKESDLLLEDESRLVGHCMIPSPFFQRMASLPRIFLECPEADRAKNILEEYILIPLAHHEPAFVMTELIRALRALRKRLGGLAADELEAKIRWAFQAPRGMESETLHQEWISYLLRHYYDPQYRHFMRHCVPAFRGKAEDCAHWLRGNSDLFS
jgi:tRNA 2-selenouridine synthase